MLETKDTFVLGFYFVILGRLFSHELLLSYIFLFRSK
jgi:hypothetical protein